MNGRNAFLFQPKVWTDKNKEKKYNYYISKFQRKRWIWVFFFSLICKAEIFHNNLLYICKTWYSPIFLPPKMKPQYSRGGSNPGLLFIYWECSLKETVCCKQTVQLKKPKDVNQMQSNFQHISMKATCISMKFFPSTKSLSWQSFVLL